MCCCERISLKLLRKKPTQLCWVFESSDGFLLSDLDGLFGLTDVIQMSAGVTRASEIWRLPLSHDLREAQCPPPEMSANSQGLCSHGSFLA